VEEAGLGERMSFSDEDLKQLKEQMDKHDGCCLVQEFSTVSMKDLLARLEAAENNMRGHVGICHRWYTQKITDMKYLKTVCVCGKRDTEKAWRKTAGK